MLAKPKELKKGNLYFYWNKSTYENKPSLKACELISLNRDKTFAKVKRLDLTVNAVQTVEVFRLVEKVEQQADLLEKKDEKEKESDSTLSKEDVS